VNECFVIVVIIVIIIVVIVVIVGYPNFRWLFYFEGSSDNFIQFRG